MKRIICYEVVETPCGCCPPPPVKSQCPDNHVQLEPPEGLVPTSDPYEDPEDLEMEPVTLLEFSIPVEDTVVEEPQISESIAWVGDLEKPLRSTKVNRTPNTLYEDPEPEVDPEAPPPDTEVPPPVTGVPPTTTPWSCITSIPSGSEGINTINADLAWSIKLTRVIAQFLSTDGLGSHTGPFLAREYVGLSFWHYSDGAVIFRGKWSGNMAPSCPPVDPPPPITSPPPYDSYGQMTPGTLLMETNPTIAVSNAAVAAPQIYHGTWHLTRGSRRANAVTSNTQRHDPAGIHWISPSLWAAASWDGVPMNPCTNSLTAIRAWMFPNTNTMRGLYQRYYEVNPFTDLRNPTPAEIDSWNIEIIRHFRRLLGLNNPIYPLRSLYKRAQWAAEASNNFRYDDTTGVGVCSGSSNQHCGATYLPDCGEFDTPSGPGQNSTYYRFPDEV